MYFKNLRQKLHITYFRMYVAVWWYAVLAFQTYTSVFLSIITWQIPLLRFLFPFQLVCICMFGSKYLYSNRNSTSNWLFKVLIASLICFHQNLLSNWCLLTYFFPQQAPGFRANGGSISYEVTWEKEEGGSKLERMSFSSACNSTRISIDNHSYRVSIMAKNDVNYSLPSVLIIPRGTGNSGSIFS